MSKNYEIQPIKLLEEDQVRKAMIIFIDGFKHLFKFAKNDAQLIELFMSACNQEQCYAYIKDGKILGFLGLGTNKICALNFSVDVCTKLFGKIKGRIICKQLQQTCAQISVKYDTDIYVDYLATAKDSRNQGIATKLLEFVFQMPTYQTCYIEVFEKNEPAKRLYEQLGFVVYEKPFHIIIALLGQGRALKMKKQI